ncbi:MAG: hypothetical protein PUD77_02600 [Clostridiales bacterium]|nr:hypothetical protein [Clostridiales bacterium]
MGKLEQMKEKYDQIEIPVELHVRVEQEIAKSREKQEMRDHKEKQETVKYEKKREVMNSGRNRKKKWGNRAFRKVRTVAGKYFFTVWK